MTEAVPKTEEKNWNDLPNELKWMIVDRMDIITRFRLKMCSKSDKCLVEMIPFYCDKVEAHAVCTVRELQDIQLRIQHVLVRFDSSTKTISIEKHRKNRFIKLSSKEEGPEMIRCMFRAFMMPQNVRIGRFFTNMRLNDLFPSPDFKLHVNKLDLYISTREENEKWLNVLAKQPNGLEVIQPWRGMGAHPVVKNVNSLSIFEQNDIDDEQLINFKATDIHIPNSKLTPVGINKLIKKMINEDYPIGSMMRFSDNQNLMEWDKVIFELNCESIFANYTDYNKAWVNMSPTKELMITRNSMNNIDLLVVKIEVLDLHSVCTRFLID